MEFLKKLKDKAVASTGSATMGVAAVILTTGGFVMAHPELTNLIPDHYKGVVVAGVGLAVALARMRTL